MLFATAPLVDGRTLKKHSLESTYTRSGFIVSLYRIKLEDLPTDVYNCSRCDGKYLNGDAGSLRSRQPVVLKCRHLFCSDCALTWVELQKKRSHCCECDTRELDWNAELEKPDESHRHWEQWDRKVNASHSGSVRQTAFSAGSSSRMTASSAHSSNTALLSPVANVRTPGKKYDIGKANSEDIEAAEILVQMSRGDANLRNRRSIRRR